eukprot:11208131-Lingulodinium_polyedra.AAC.1
MFVAQRARVFSAPPEHAREGGVGREEKLATPARCVRRKNLARRSPIRFLPRQSSRCSKMGSCKRR